MSTFEELLGIDVSNRRTQRAAALAEQDFLLMRDLVTLRKKKRLSQEVVGAEMGISQASVAAFERLDNDPKLSTIRRYAIAIGALIAHSVEEDTGQLADGARIDAKALYIPNAYVVKRPNVKHGGRKLAVTSFKRTDFAMAA